MPIEEQHLADAFDTLLAEPMPPNTVDLGRILDDGHRLLRRRRALRALAGAAVVGVVCAAAPALLPGDGPGPSGTVIPATSATTDAHTDPLTVHAVFGWLPASTGDISYQHKPVPGSPTSFLDSAQARKSTMDEILEVSLTTPGPGLTSLIPWGTQQAGLINGHPAYWLSEAPGQLAGHVIPKDVVTFWSPSGQWVQLQTQDVSKQDALRIARTMVFAPSSVLLPLRLTGLPADAVTEAELRTDHGALDLAEVAFTIDGTDVTVYAEPSDKAAAIGTPAAESAVRTMNGLRIRVTLDRQDGGRPTGDPASYFNYITSLGRNPADWTAAVLAPGGNG